MIFFFFLHSKILSMRYKFDFSRSKLSVITNTVFSSSRKKKKKPDEKAEAAADDCCVLLQLPFNRLNNCAPYTRTEIIVFCITKDVLSGRNEANLCEIVLPNFDQRETVFTEKWIEKWRVIMQLPSFAPLP